MSFNEIHQVASDGPSAGYKALLAAVIHQAVTDAKAGGPVGNEAEAWITSDDCLALLSYLIPYAMESDATILQAQLIQQLPRRVGVLV